MWSAGKVTARLLGYRGMNARIFSRSGSVSIEIFAVDSAAINPIPHTQGVGRVLNPNPFDQRSNSAAMMFKLPRIATTSAIR